MPGFVRTKGRLDGRRVVVAGVGSAIGAACAQLALTEGAEVLAVDPSSSAIAELQRVIGDDRLHGCVSPFDTEEGAATAGAWCDEHWGRVDALIHCGSAMEVWPKGDDTTERALDVLTTNVRGPLTYTLAFESMLDNGAIVYLGSIDGIRGNPQVQAYSMGKGALLPLTHTMAAKLGPRGIRVNCVAAAGLVQTGSGTPPIEREFGDSDLLLRLTPLGRRPEVTEVASVLVFLASPDSSYVSGAVIPVDGGRIAATPATY